jgi:hypothetical protein
VSASAATVTPVASVVGECRERGELPLCQVGVRGSTDAHEFVHDQVLGGLSWAFSLSLPSGHGLVISAVANPVLGVASAGVFNATRVAGRGSVQALTGEELWVLRREAASFLSRLQALEGFESRRRSLPPMPDGVEELRWDHVDAICTSGRVELIGWRYWEAERNPRVAEQLRVSAPGWISDEDGEEVIGLPWRLEFPTGVSEADKMRIEEYREALARYWEGVRRFSSRFLLGAVWAPGALHLALIHDDVIRLPQAPPGRLMLVPAEIRLTIQSDEPVTEGSSLVWRSC